MPQPTLCMIHEAIGNQSAIAKVAAWGVRQALAAGWKVTVVAKFLDESLQGDVEWLRLTVPPRGFFLQWTTARHFITSALGGRTFDVIHAHQPQVAALSDVFQCHFLTRVAFERHCLESRPGLRPALIRAQQQGVLHAEDYYYRRWNPHTRMLYDSALTRSEFIRLYGSPSQEQVFLYAFPPLRFAEDSERRAARKRFFGEHIEPIAPVIGYLGGIDERKGYKRILEAFEKPGLETVHLLLGGQYTDSFTPPPSVSDRCRAVGLVSNTNEFYAACDALVVPSLFEPYGLVASEAAARGVPVIATNEVGALPHLLEYGAGLAWNTGTPLGPLVERAVRERLSFQEGARRMGEDLSESEQGKRLLAVYADVLQEKALENRETSRILEAR